ncbi:MAG: helix-turn-helix domain-containing protein [Dissulfurispiraceae bacterium]
MTLLKNSVEQFERDEITNALKESNWVMARAARKLGITYRMIGYKIKKYGIKRGEDRREIGISSHMMRSTEKQA